MCSKRHIFLLTAHNFHYKSLIFSYVSLLGCPKKSCKFGSFAYSRWLPKWLSKFCEHSALHSFDQKTLKFWYISLLGYFKKLLKFGSFAYSKWPKCVLIGIFFYLQATIFIVRVSFFHMFLFWGVLRYYVNLANLHIQDGC